MPTATNIVRIAALGDLHYERTAVRETFPDRPFRIVEIDTTAAASFPRSGDPRGPKGLPDRT